MNPGPCVSKPALVVSVVLKRARVAVGCCLTHWNGFPLTSQQTGVWPEKTLRVTLESIGAYERSKAEEPSLCGLR